MNYVALVTVKVQNQWKWRTFLRLRTVVDLVAGNRSRRTQRFSQLQKKGNTHLRKCIHCRIPKRLKYQMQAEFAIPLHPSWRPRIRACVARSDASIFRYRDVIRSCEIWSSGSAEGSSLLECYSLSLSMYLYISQKTWMFKSKISEIT